MPRLHSLARFAFGTLLLAACGEDTTLTQPESWARPALPRSAAALASNTWAPRASAPNTSNEGYAVGAAPNGAGQWIAYTLGRRRRGGMHAASLASAYNVADQYPGAPCLRRSARPIQLNKRRGQAGRPALSHRGQLLLRRLLPHLQYHLGLRSRATNRLLQRADMPRATKDGTSGVIGGKLFVLAGYCTGKVSYNPGHCAVGGPVRQFYRYDPGQPTPGYPAGSHRTSTPVGGSGVLGSRQAVRRGRPGRAPTSTCTIRRPTPGRRGPRIPSPTMAISSPRPSSPSSTWSGGRIRPAAAASHTLTAYSL